MAVRPIVLYPDRRLKTVCEAVGIKQGALSPYAKTVIDDLIDTCKSQRGCVGIAAPQIGELVRICVIDVTDHKKSRSCHGLTVLVDPVIVEQSGQKMMREGCLSIPDFTGNVQRAETVTVRAQNEHGELRTLTCDAYEARVLLHELDHLDGYLFLDRVSSARDIFPRKNYQ